MKFLRIGETMTWEDWTRYKSSTLGMHKALQVNISRSLKHLSLGMLHIPPLFINNYRLAYVEPKVLFVHMMRAILGVPLLFYFVVRIKLKDLNFWIRERVLTWLFNKFTTHWSSLISFWSSLLFTLVLHLYPMSKWLIELNIINLKLNMLHILIPWGVMTSHIISIGGKIYWKLANTALVTWTINERILKQERFHI